MFTMNECSIKTFIMFIMMDEKDKVRQISREIVGLATKIGNLFPFESEPKIR
jgi:hypothetical protein